MKSIYESSTRELMKQFITSENIQKGEKFNREKIRNWFNKNYPKLKPGTIDAHINSMTIKERISPKILNGNRRKRIAQGSGTSIQDVNRLI